MAFEDNPLNRLPDISEIPSETPVFVPWRFFTFSLIFFFTIFIINFGLANFLISKLNDRISVFDSQIIDIKKLVQQTDKEGISRFYSKIYSLGNLLNNHLTAEPYLNFLDKRTLADVNYVAVGINSKEKGLTISGEAGSFASVANQLAVYEAADEVIAVEFKGTRLNSNKSGVSFNVDLKFK